MLPSPFWFKDAFTCGYCYGYRYCFFILHTSPWGSKAVNWCTDPRAPWPVKVSAWVCVYMCVLSVPVVEVNVRPPSVCPVRGASISRQDVKHFNADLVLVIASHSRVVNALKIVCPYLSKRISPYCPEQHKNTPSAVTYTPLPGPPPPSLHPSVSNHVPPSSVSINLYDTRLHLSNVSGLDRSPVQKFLIQPVLYVYRWASYNLTGLIKQHGSEKAERSMCYDPHLFRLCLSPPQLISLHPHLAISPYFLPHRFWGGKGGDGRKRRWFGTSWSGSYIHRCRRDCLF